MAAWIFEASRRASRRAVSFGRVLAGLLVIGLSVTATQLRSPILLGVRGVASILVLGGALLMTALSARALRRAAGRRERAYFAALLVGALLAAGLFAQVQVRHLRARQAALGVVAGERAVLARHIVAGFRTWDEARLLVGEALVGGVYVGLHNARGLSLDELRARIAELRGLRAARGLSPLLVTIDQEGGPVSRLSPPLPHQPGLSAAADGADTPQAREQAARALASEQARALRYLGANVNFSPVVDLRLHRERSFWDRYSFIGARAISADPAVVAGVARAYVEELLAQGVVPVAKHFPGLGRVRTDTHFFTADLATSVAELQATDWLPFRAVLATVPTMLMLGHVRLTALDGEHLAGTSAPLIDGVLRKDFGYAGVIITDDLCMSPAFYGPGGIAGFAREALRAGVDLVLISYDGSQVYPVLAELARAHAELADALRTSDARLDRLSEFLGRKPRP